MSRSGRKRKQGRRKPSGDLALPAVNYRAMAAEQPHRRNLPADMRQDQLAATEFGRMYLLGTLSELQHGAGERYARVVGQYRAMIEVPRATSGAGHGYDCSGCVVDDCRCARRKRSYEDAFEALNRSGRRVLMTVNRVVLDGGECLPGWIGVLRSGLDVLAEQFGLTAGRQIMVRGKLKIQNCVWSPGE